MCNLLKSVLAAGLVLLLAACGAQTGAPGDANAEQTTAGAGANAVQTRLPVTVTGADGEEAAVEDASRIVPLNGDIAEIIFALGLGEEVAAETEASVNGYRPLTPESLAAAQPDVLLLLSGGLESLPSGSAWSS